MNESAGLMIGWREWVALPELGLPAIKVKVDTGARSSALHAFDIEHDKTTATVAFSVHPLQRNADLVVRCQAPVVDVRSVTDSGGHTEERLFIRTEVEVGRIRRAIEITLTERHDMLFRMLLGRTALIPDITVSPVDSFLCGRVAARKLYARISEGSRPVDGRSQGGRFEGTNSRGVTR